MKMLNTLKVLSEVKAQVVIIGGGMVGATLAYTLAPFVSGQIIVIEKEDGRVASTDHSAAVSSVFDDRSITLSRPTVGFLHEHGLWSDLSANATPIESIKISRPGQFGSATLKAEDSGLKALGYVLPNKCIGTVLRHRIADINSAQKSVGDKSAVELQAKVLWLGGRSVAACTANRDGWEIVTQSEGRGTPEKSEKIMAKFCIVADGANSNTRRLLGVSASVEDHQQVAMVSMLDSPKLVGSSASFSPNTAYEFFLPEGESVALVPRTELGMAAGENAETKGDRYGLIWIATQQRLNAWKQQSLGLRRVALAKLCCVRPEAFGQLIAPPEYYPLKTVIAREQVRPNLVLVGNSAHALHPIAGQGFNLAIRDIKALLELFSESVHHPKSTPNFSQLLQYESVRAQDQRRVAAFCHGLLTVFAQDSAVLSMVRQGALAAFDFCTPAKTALSRKIIAPQ